MWTAVYIDLWVFVGWKSGVYKIWKSTYVVYDIFVKYVTEDVTIHLRITTMLIISSVQFKYCYVWVILSSRRSRLSNEIITTTVTQTLTAIYS